MQYVLVVRIQFCILFAIMKLKLCIAVIVGMCVGASSAALKGESKKYVVPQSPEAANVWFYDIATLGRKGGELSEFIRIRFRKNPAQVQGELLSTLPDRNHVVKWTPEQRKAFETVIDPKETYWLLQWQGPWSNQQMIMIFSGEPFAEATLIYRQIVERAFF